MFLLRENVVRTSFFIASVSLILAGCESTFDNDLPLPESESQSDPSESEDNATSVSNSSAPGSKSTSPQTERPTSWSVSWSTMAALDNRRSPRPGDSFRDIREEGRFFVDKTPLLERLLDDGRKFYWMTQRGGHGKTVFVQMMRSFFKGERTYFENLSIYNRGNGDKRGEWIEYPVVYLDFSALNIGNVRTADDFVVKLRNELLRIAKLQYGLTYVEDDFVLSGMVEELAQRKGHPVVILIDNYGLPVQKVHLHSVVDRQLLQNVEQSVREFFESIKGCRQHLKLMFASDALDRLDGYDFVDIFEDKKFASVKELMGFNHYRSFRTRPR